MQKTTIQQAIEKAEETITNTRALQRRYSEKGNMHWIHKANADVLEIHLSLLQSLLPAEQKIIEDSFDIGKNGSVIMTGADYYLTTFKTDKNGE